MSLKSKTISSLAWKLLERSGSSVVGLVVQIVLARLLAPEAFGALAIMLVFVNIGNVIVQSGLNTALVQFPGVNDDDCSTVFWLSLCISVVLYVLVFLAAPVIASFYSMDELIWPLRAMALVLIINAYNAVQIAIVQRNLELRKVFNATIVSVLISGTIGIGLAFWGTGLWALVAQQLIYQLVNCCVLALQVSWRPRLVFSASRAKRFFSFGWKLLASGLLDVGYQSLSDLVIGKQFSATQLGYVSQGKRYPQALGSMLDGAIQPVMLSAVSRVQDDLSYVKRLVRRALKTSCYLIMPCMTLFALVAEPLVRLLLGEQWLPCVYFLQVYCFTQALLPIHTSNLQALNAMGRSDLFLKLELIKKSYGLVFLLVTAFVFKDIYLMIGSYLLSGIISTFVNAYPNKRVIGYPYIEQVRDITPGIVLSLISAAIAWSVSLLMLPDGITILLQTIVMAAAYLGFSKLFHVEALEYLLATGKELFASKRNHIES
ncbi:lipopolysaccharide biosynthesis protein [Adlercreutzia sp. ZJ304]|uniref:lipopolysaccharide biosynthesis protein n=1 Tax=Adlercreutzia sp. ZJ304 TaxID=2709791 RepID=UPI0013EA9B21|nr:lipopolysaccharide biosynthesis protein [Adlercreutzia sp. ZJ304]